MDEEDIREADESRGLQTSEDFAGLGSTQSHVSTQRGLMDLLKSGGETMGVRLLKKMGWKEGQGIGPKVRRKANLTDEALQSGTDTTTYLFAPENTPPIAFVRKGDQKGLGFEGDSPLHRVEEQADTVTDAYFDRRLDKEGKLKPKNSSRRGGFGVGVLNDTGSDEEDPYSVGPQISYNRTIGGDKKKKKGKVMEGAKTTLGSSNPLLNNKPVFISKKMTLATNASRFQKCHDGRLPLDGFILADSMASLSVLSNKYDPPEIPKDWKSSKKSPGNRNIAEYVSTAEAAKASTLDPKARAKLLGETQLPGKSVFDWMTPEARERIARLTGKGDLPPARSERAPKGFEMSESQKKKDFWDLVPKLDKGVAVQALTRAVGGWMPYSEDEKKRARYRTFLEVRAGLRDSLPDRAEGLKTDEWINEMHEFARAAEVFKPISGLMASRFTSASSTPLKASDQMDASASQDSLLSRPPAKREDPAEEAAKLGMFGPLTRSAVPFYPSRLLCKRFNIKPPAHVQLDPGERPGDHGGSNISFTPKPLGNSTLDLVSRDVMDQLVLQTIVDNPLDPLAPDKPVIIEPERNDALEGERPGEMVFKAIFGSDDDEDE